MGVDDSLDMTEHLSDMIKSGFTVKRNGEDVAAEIVHTESGAVLVEFKDSPVMPDTMECGHCGGTMDLVSIEDGYSCRNEGCLLHFQHLEQE
jgi:hypothetical protein